AGCFVPVTLLLGFGRFAETDADQLRVHPFGGGNDRLAIRLGALVDVAEIRRRGGPRQKDQSEGGDDAAQAGHGGHSPELAISGNWSPSPLPRFADDRGNYRAVFRDLPVIHPLL